MMAAPVPWERQAGDLSKHVSVPSDFRKERNEASLTTSIHPICLAQTFPSSPFQRQALRLSHSTTGDEVALNLFDWLPGWLPTHSCLEEVNTARDAAALQRMVQQHLSQRHGRWEVVDKGPNPKGARAARPVPGRRMGRWRKETEYWKAAVFSEQLVLSVAVAEAGRWVGSQQQQQHFRCRCYRASKEEEQASPPTARIGRTIKSTSHQTLSLNLTAPAGHKPHTHLTFIFPNFSPTFKDAGACRMGSS
ncbi:hypothetical protein HDK64DRAFT_318766, partial [Phyllosticta capitalensis]